MTTRELAVALVEGALAELEAERTLINDLNVYPVPDGDTGTNLLLTVRAVREELERTAEDDDIAATVTRGSLMGARGNSGVILSQIVRGACSVCRPGTSVTTATLKRAFEEATTAAYRAVKKPVEGTMLTVTREMSSAAARMPDDMPLKATIETVLNTGRLAVDRTQHQLAVLRQAGVVDAGGYGLLVICRGLAAALTGERPAKAAVADGGQGMTRPGVPAVALEGPSELSRYRYCTSFLLTGDDLPRDELEQFLAPIGDSALMVGDADMLKVHVHVDDPGVVLSWAVAHGGLSEVEVNDMHAQTRERDARLTAADGAPPTAHSVVVAVVAGSGNQALFREIGCAGIVDGGQSMNPSAAQLLGAINDLGCDEVVVLPNNGNVILTAEQAATMSTRSIVVVPTKSMPAGLTAMVAFDPGEDAVKNAAAMTASLSRAHSAEITAAVRDSFVGELDVKKGEVIGLVDGALVAKGDDVLAVLDDVVRHLGAHAPEIVTVLTSLNGTSISDDDISAVVARLLPQAEIVIQTGGQPLYPILIGAE